MSFLSLDTAKVEFDYSIDQIIEKNYSIEQQSPSNPYKQRGNRKTKKIGLSLARKPIERFNRKNSDSNYLWCLPT